MREFFEAAKALNLLDGETPNIIRDSLKELAYQKSEQSKSGLFSRKKSPDSALRELEKQFNKMSPKTESFDSLIHDLISREFEAIRREGLPPRGTDLGLAMTDASFPPSAVKVSDARTTTTASETLSTASADTESGIEDDKLSVLSDQFDRGRVTADTAPKTILGWFIEPGMTLTSGQKLGLKSSIEGLKAQADRLADANEDLEYFPMFFKPVCDTILSLSETDFDDLIDFHVRGGRTESGVDDTKIKQLETLFDEGRVEAQTIPHQMIRWFVSKGTAVTQEDKPVLRENIQKLKTQATRLANSGRIDDDFPSVINTACDALIRNLDNYIDRHTLTPELLFSELNLSFSLSDAMATGEAAAAQLDEIGVELVEADDVVDSNNASQHFLNVSTTAIKSTCQALEHDLNLRPWLEIELKHDPDTTQTFIETGEAKLSDFMSIIASKMKTIEEAGLSADALQTKKMELMFAVAHVGKKIAKGIIQSQFNSFKQRILADIKAKETAGDMEAVNLLNAKKDAIFSPISNLFDGFQNQMTDVPVFEFFQTRAREVVPGYSEGKAKPVVTIDDHKYVIVNSSKAGKKELGRGGLSRVRTAVEVNPSNGSVIGEFAIKKLNAKGAKAGIEQYREVTLMKKLKDLPVVQTRGGFQYGDGKHKSTGILLEKAKGSLHRPIIERLKPTLPRDGLKGSEDTTKPIMQLFRELVLVISKLHEAGITHNDIKLDNFLIDESGQIKAADFGLTYPSESLEDFEYLGLVRNQLGGTNYAPEAVDIWRGATTDLSTVDSQKFDIFSLGTILADMTRNGKMVQDYENHTSGNKVFEFCTALESKFASEPANPKEALFRDILKGATNRNPTERLTSAQLLAKIDEYLAL